MCGIFAIARPTVRPDWDSARCAIESVSRCAELLCGGTHSRPGATNDLLAVLSHGLEASYLLVGAPAFIPVALDEALLTSLRRALEQVKEGVRRLENAAERGASYDRPGPETLNLLITGGRDLAWRIEVDVLQNAKLTGQLLAPQESAPPSAWGHAWQLNLTLNNLDRLEVRGRDSAGIAAYVHFPSERTLDDFLASPDKATLAGEYAERTRLRSLSHRAVVRPESDRSTLLFAFKVAAEVGELGSNVRYLREAITSDRMLQAALRQPGASLQLLSHTRWASNGVISVPNCHPVDSALSLGASDVSGTAGAIVAVLNGDVDNYQDLMQRYVRSAGFDIDQEITTDAKIIPLVIGHHYRACGRLEEAFRRAFDEFEGSMVIGIMAADRPGEFLFAQKGSGQGLFFGLARDCVAASSEMYGLVELTHDYLKAEGEQTPEGEMFRVSLQDGRVRLSLLTAEGLRDAAPERIRRAEITTRDINRADYPRFLLKEITESADSVEKTMRGKLELDPTGAPEFRFSAESLPRGLIEGLRNGSVRKIIAMGQGTAAIAAEGVAWLLRRALAGTRHPIEVSASKATEISGHALRDDMSDTVVVAVSQSGTTTDTNRTVDLVKQRGAWVLAIVNRRNSDLVYKAHGVLYTSDGRDIEMSVASTKAFYSQNAAGALLALALAETLSSMTAEEIKREAKALTELPGTMRRTLDLSTPIQKLAEFHALRHTYWAVVGSGSGKIAADEIRIKLSELCYKSIASDYLEDKKHIDLSSEPLVLVCASGAPASTVSDLVKEVAIFKAHRSVPLVIADEGEQRFDPYAAGVVQVPRCDGALSYLLATMAGHLFGYHAAASFDRQATALRSIRAGITTALMQHPRTASPDAMAITGVPALPPALLNEVSQFDALLEDGGLDSCLRPGTAARLTAILMFLLGRISADDLARQLKISAEERLGDAALRIVSSAISELARPIDAIKHQAKTVTVGISRLQESPAEGILWRELRALGVPIERLAPSHRAFVTSFGENLSGVRGAMLYRVSKLDAVGRPRPESEICVERKTGVAMHIASRCDTTTPLTGTKWGVVMSREIYVGYGQQDGRRIAIIPFVGEMSDGHLVLLHLEPLTRSDRATRLRALAAQANRLEQLRVAVTERNCPWEDSHIDAVDSDTLFFKSIEAAAEAILLSNRGRT